jgi:predicted enzyme related to lactoylglutathione lyase
MAGIGALDWMHVFVDVPPAAASTTRAFWSRALGWQTGPQWAQHPEFRSLIPDAGDRYVHVQEIDGDPRVHLDVVVDDLDIARDTLLDQGAEAAPRTAEWQVMRSPGGFPFCLCRKPAVGRRPPATRHNGHRSRLVQVCIDAPADRFEREVAFWQEATGWDYHPSPHNPELADLRGPATAPLRLLMQRLGADDPGTTTRAHIDLGSDDLDAEADRLVSFGARKVGPGKGYVDRTRGWVLMADPAGLPFCVTSKPPN